MRSALSAPQRLSLICANEGKLAELEHMLAQDGQTLPGTVLRINLVAVPSSSRPAWDKTIEGLQTAPPGMASQRQSPDQPGTMSASRRSPGTGPGCVIRGS